MPFPSSDKSNIQTEENRTSSSTRAGAVIGAIVGTLLILLVLSMRDISIGAVIFAFFILHIVAPLTILKMELSHEVITHSSFMHEMAGTFLSDRAVPAYFLGVIVVCGVLGYVFGSKKMPLIFLAIAFLALLVLIDVVARFYYADLFFW